MHVRLIPELGGDGSMHGVICMNDTGSDVMTLFDTDLGYLGNLDEYRGWNPPINVCFANGERARHQSLSVQVQMVRNDGTPWTGWMSEDVVLTSLTPGKTRLSGAGIRAHLYIATAPGNRTLSVSTTVGGLTSILQ